MEIGDLEITRLELKYCERCGKLWLRQRGTGRVYCEACTSEIPYFPLCGRRLSRPRMPVKVQAEIGSQDGTVRFIVSGGGGQA
jgi:hypothetical protein